MSIAQQSYLSSTSPRAVRDADFRQARHGYNRDEVRAFLARLASELEALESERTTLRAEVAALHDELEAARGSTTAEDRSQQQMEISVRAVNLLSQAQLAADSCVAEAESYARDLVSTARDQYREILQRAQQTASEAVRDMPSVEVAAIGDGYTEPVQEIEYIRTFARVAQIQLRSVLDALTTEVEKLGQLPQFSATQPRPDAPPVADGQPRIAMQAEVTWLPNLPAAPPGFAVDA